MDENVLIRTFKNKEPRIFLQFLKEAEILEKLDGKSPVFIKYYGLKWFYNENKQLYCLSLVTELCERSLINAITNRAQDNNRYEEKRLIDYMEILLKGFIALKENGFDHDNIKPHVILFNNNSELKITGLITPKYKIKSDCNLPNYSSTIIQSNSGYLSPEKCKNIKEGRKYDIEKSDIFSLGLVFLQMSILKPIDNWNHKQIFRLWKDLNSFGFLNCWR